MCDSPNHSSAFHRAALRVLREFPNLSPANQYALARYDADVAEGKITFAPNGHRDTPTRPDVWLAGRPAR